MTIQCKTGIEPLGPVDYDKQPPDAYRCSSCGQKGRRLWRDYNVFLDHQRLLCLSCAKVDQYRDDGRERMGDQVGNMIPAVPTEDGDTFWGYSSVPTPGVVWWYAMAECCTDDDSEGGRQRRRVERWRKSHDGMERLYGYERKSYDQLRVKLEKVETDLVKTTAELVACEMERDEHARRGDNANLRLRDIYTRANPWGREELDIADLEPFVQRMREERDSMRAAWDAVAKVAGCEELRPEHHGAQIIRYLNETATRAGQAFRENTALRFDVERMRSTLECLNQRGGLGHWAHGLIDAALSKEESK